MVYLERVWTGGFFVFEGLGDSLTPPDTFVLHRKPLVHVVKKKALFTRNSDLPDELTTANRGWKLSAISLGQGWSRPVSTVEIHRVEINTSSGETYVFENPDETMLAIPEDIPLAVKGEKVRVTVQVSNTMDAPVYHPDTGATETLLLHYGINRFHHARRQFEFKGVDPQSGYNLYQGEWTVHEPALRPFHAVVDAIDNGTIYDEDGEYNSATWGFPYRVVLSK
jgi:hypothetical protein